MHETNKALAIIVDDISLSAAGLRALAGRVFAQDQIRVPENLPATLALADTGDANVFIVNYQLRYAPALNVIGDLMERNRRAAVLLTGMPFSGIAITAALHCGVRGLMLHSDAEECLVSGLRALTSGLAYFSPQIALMLVQIFSTGEGERHAPILDLSNQEREILQRLSIGENNSTIACELKLTLRAVQSSRARLSRKLNSKSMADLVRLAHEEGIL